ncbi:post-GPI attachment to proteins factor 2 [Drosophila ficusphila]|uniref:post-GPI attachment to proteins factor 2 n=1 Tax=Drosophila ficusphila TaxID=30025 RepID=UPI0007E846E8|nr:post-GPI attachment to proteins factor 2 [Drosophila ficusphila]
MKDYVDDQSKLLPSSIMDLRPRRSFRVPMGPVLGLGLMQVPICMVFNLVMAIATDFEATTYSTCHAFNIFPSTSAAAKSQHKLWAWACWLEFPFLIASALLQFRLYRAGLPRPVRSFGCLIAIFLALKGFILLLWGTFPRENGDSALHIAIALSLFVLCAVHIAGSFVCAKYYIHPRNRSLQEELSLRLKSGLLFPYFVSVVVMWVFYFIHHKWCVSFAYSIFAMSEFISCECFGLFISLAYLDFYHVYLCYDQRLGFFLGGI